MKALKLVVLSLAVLATNVRAQDRADPEVLRTSLPDMLALLTVGILSVPADAVQVTQSGDQFHVRLPLSGFIAPAGASVEALARPDAKQAWDLTAMTLPAAGALGSSVDNVVSYRIGRQATRGRIDPKLTTSSTIVSALDAITLQSTAGEQNTEQTIEHIKLDSLLSGRSDGRVDLHVQDTATNWHVVAADPGDTRSDGLVRQVTGQFVVSDLDRARGGRFMAAARTFMQTVNTPGYRSNPDPANLRGMVDALPGLLTKVDANETLSGLRFDLGHGNTGSLDGVRLHLQGAAQEQRLNAVVEIAMDRPTLVSLPADTAAFVPHHLSARAVLTGIPLERLMPLLQAATGLNPDQAVLQRQAIALLSVPGAKAAIESIAFDAGPLQVNGSAQFQPRTDGQVGTDIHLSASGIDAALAQLPASPNVQGAIPFIVLAKGFGRVEGNRITWDISFGGGPPTINGIPFGQSAARTR